MADPIAIAQLLAGGNLTISACVAVLVWYRLGQAEKRIDKIAENIGALPSLPIDRLKSVEDHTVAHKEELIRLDGEILRLRGRVHDLANDVVAVKTWARVRDAAFWDDSK